MVVNVQIAGSYAIYDITHERDEIYVAKLLKKSYQVIFNYPEKIILIKVKLEWVSDHHFKEIGLIIGRKIDEEEKREEV